MAESLVPPAPHFALAHEVSRRRSDDSRVWGSWGLQGDARDPMLAHPVLYCFLAPRSTISRNAPRGTFPSPGQRLRHFCLVRAVRDRSPWILWSCPRGKHLNEVTACRLAVAAHGLDVARRSHGATGTFDDLRPGTIGN